MGVKDILITPLYLIFFCLLAYVIRPYVTNNNNRKYFLPTLFLKFLGAMTVGFIYQFYYSGGDTFTYFNLGSKYIWEAFLEDPLLAYRLITADGNFHGNLFRYTSQMYNYGDSASYFVVRVAGFFDIFTLHSYLPTSLYFALISFSGIWMIYLTFCKFYPALYRYLAYGILFFPSLIFWGSGLLKDSLTLGALGWLFYGLSHLFIFREKNLTNILLVLAGTYVLYIIKIYILICFLPAITFWFFVYYSSNVRNTIIKIIIGPPLILFGLFAGYHAFIFVSQDHYRYSLDNLGSTAEQTAQWNYYVSQRDQGSGYTLGDYDFSPSGLVRKFIPAVITTLYRPFLFEVANVVMLLSALENLTVLILTILAVLNLKKLTSSLKDPVVLFCFIFAILFSFAIGVTTYNLGSLVRYKIPMLPFLMAGLIVIKNYKVGNDQDRNYSKISQQIKYQ